MARASLVRLDLNSPEFQDVFFRLEATELKQVVAALRRLRELEWSTLYRHTGFKWEAIEHWQAPNGVFDEALLGEIRAPNISEHLKSSAGAVDYR